MQMIVADIDIILALGLDAVQREGESFGCPRSYFARLLIASDVVIIAVVVEFFVELKHDFAVVGLVAIVAHLYHDITAVGRNLAVDQFQIGRFVGCCHYLYFFA
jgi:hypothetical protein